MKTRLVRALIALAFVAASFAPAGAAPSVPQTAPMAGTSRLDPEALLASAAAAAPIAAASSAPLDDTGTMFRSGSSDDPITGRLSAPIEIALLLTLLSLLPAALICLTSFTRIVIVLSFVRRSLSTNELPPNPVVLGLALFLTLFVMAPVGKRIHAAAYAPYAAGEMSAEQAGERAWGELRGFLLDNTRPGEVAFFRELAAIEETTAADELPFQVVVPAFVLSELKTAFQMGFLLFLPFLVIDLVVSSVLLSMGMFMLPPVMISTPFKILLFVLVDGWTLVCRSLVTSFAVT
jgi:flagellar biosynthesis protein FliP